MNNISLIYNLFFKLVITIKLQKHILAKVNTKSQTAISSFRVNRQFDITKSQFESKS